MRISDWSSDVCSSDLADFGDTGPDAVDVIILFRDLAETKQHLGLGGGETASVDAHRGNMAVASINNLVGEDRAGQAVAAIAINEVGRDPAHLPATDRPPVERDRKSTRLNSSH